MGCPRWDITVLSQTTCTADEVIFHKIGATDDIKMILGKFGSWEVPHAGKMVSST